MKTGGTVTFFNSGIRTVLSPAEIKSGRITNKDGLKILDMFNINDAVFCDIFNGNLKKGYDEDVWKTMSQKQKNQLKNFLISGVGHGYTIVHKLTGKTKVYEIDKTYMTSAATPTSCNVYYGGKSGTGKRIWVKKNIPGTPLILAAAEAKKNYAKKDAILIDDRVSNINDWINAGGIGILHTSTSTTKDKLSKYGI